MSNKIGNLNSRVNNKKAIHRQQLQVHTEPNNMLTSFYKQQKQKHELQFEVITFQMPPLRFCIASLALMSINTSLCSGTVKV
jgi:hypothetical protein